MLAFGKEGILKTDEIVTVANYVRSLSGLPTRPGYDAAAGKKIFAENCVACHGEAGKGNQEVGAPNLTDKIWLYGSDEATIIETITNGRAGVMPAWDGSARSHPPSRRWRSTSTRSAAASRFRSGLRRNLVSFELDQLSLADWV